VRGAAAKLHALGDGCARRRLRVGRQPRPGRGGGGRRRAASRATCCARGAPIAKIEAIAAQGSEVQRGGDRLGVPRRGARVRREHGLRSCTPFDDEE